MKSFILEVETENSEDEWNLRGHLVQSFQPCFSKPLPFYVGA